MAVAWGVITLPVSGDICLFDNAVLAFCSRSGVAALVVLHR